MHRKKCGCVEVVFISSSDAKQALIVFWPMEPPMNFHHKNSKFRFRKIIDAEAGDPILNLFW